VPTKSLKRKLEQPVTETPAARDGAEGVTSKVQALADWLQLDIRRRGLRPGDRYLTSEEAARMLDVSTGTAHQAMRLLVEQSILDRRHKQGTFVGLGVNPPEITARPRVYIVSPADATRDSSYSRISDAIYPAIASALGGATLQLEYLPAENGLRFLRQLVEEAEAAGNLGGFILFRSTYEIQDYFDAQSRRIPTLAFGGVYPGIENLPWLEADQRQIGELAADYALRAGHKRMAVLMHERWAPGDSRLMSGIAQTMETSKDRLERFEICSLPAYERAIKHRVRELLSAKDRPTVIVARMALQVSIVYEVAAELGLRLPEDLEVVFANLGSFLPSWVSIPHAVSEISLHEIAAEAGKMLASLRQGQLPEPFGRYFPVRYVERVI
jgi:DNA-binding LacI/PurR family transcriptional regulator